MVEYLTLMYMILGPVFSIAINECKNKHSGVLKLSKSAKPIYQNNISNFSCKSGQEGSNNNLT